LDCVSALNNASIPTFRDWASEKTDFPRKVIEIVLAQEIENKAMQPI